MRFQNKKPQDIFVEKGWLKMTKDDDGNGMYFYMYLYEFVYVFVYVFVNLEPSLLMTFPFLLLLSSIPSPLFLLLLYSFASVPSPPLLRLCSSSSYSSLTEIVTAPEKKSKNNLALDLIRRKRELSEPAPMPSKTKGDTKSDTNTQRPIPKGDSPIPKGDTKKPKLNAVKPPPEKL